MTFDDDWLKTTSDGRQILTEDTLQLKMSFDGGQPLMEESLWWKTTIDGRWPWKDTYAWDYYRSALDIAVAVIFSLSSSPLYNKKNDSGCWLQNVNEPKNEDEIQNAGDFTMAICCMVLLSAMLKYQGQLIVCVHVRSAMLTYSMLSDPNSHCF